MTIENVKNIRLLDNIREVGLFHKLPIFDGMYELEAKPTDLVVLSGGVRDGLGYTPYWTSTSGRDHILFWRIDIKYIGNNGYLFRQYF